MRERNCIRLEFTGSEVLFLDLLLLKFKEVDPTMTKSKMIMMLFYEYISFLTDKKAVNSLIDNIVKEAHEARCSGALKDALALLREKHTLRTPEDKAVQALLTPEQEIALVQKEFELGLIEKEETYEREDNKSCNPLPSQRSFFEAGIRDFFSEE